MSKFRITIKSKLYYRMGNSIKIEVEIKNVTKRDYYVLIRNTPFESMDSDCFTVSCNGEKAEYDSAIAKRGPVSERSFMLLKAGEMVRREICLAERYLLGGAGLIKLCYEPELIYTAYIDRFEEYLHKETVKPVRKTFFLFYKKEIYPTRGVTERLKNKYDYIGIIEERSGTDEEFPEPSIKFNDMKRESETPEKFQKMVRRSYYEMIHYIKHCNDELQTGVKMDNLHYQMAFGAYDQKRYERVQEVYRIILEAVRKVQFFERNMIYDDDYDGTYAYVFPNNPIIYLCRGYVTANFSGTDSRMGIILHELSHMYAKTDDVRYGRDRCRALAQKRPEDAIRNADNYEFFLESKFMNWMKEDKWPGCNDMDISTYGGPAIISKNQSLYLFYKNSEEKLKTAGYDGTVFGESMEMKDSKDKTILSAFQPEAVLYKNQMYVFYINKTEKGLYYTYKEGNTWAEGKPVCYISGSMEVCLVRPLCTPQPAVYCDKIFLVYRKEEEETMFMTSWDGKVWKEEEDVPNSTYFAKTLCCNPAVTGFGKFLYTFYICHESSWINYAYYDLEADVWSMDHIIKLQDKVEEFEDELIESKSEIRAVTINDVVYLFYIGLDGELYQTCLNSNLKTKERVFADYEVLVENTVGKYPLSANSLVSYAHTDNFGYLTYRNKNKEICISCQMPV